MSAIHGDGSQVSNHWARRIRFLDKIYPFSRAPQSYRIPSRISLRAIVEVFKFEWRIIVVYTLSFLLVGAVYCIVTPPQYEASVQVVPGDFTTKSTTTVGAAGLASLLLNSAPSQSDAVKRFVTVLYSPDLARQLAAHQPIGPLFGDYEEPTWLSKIFGARKKPLTYEKKVRIFEAQLNSIGAVDGKKTLATGFYYRSSDPRIAQTFLNLAARQGDEILRQYNLSEIRYDDEYLSHIVGGAQNIDVKLVLAQKLVETQLRRMDANRSEFFSIRMLGPVEVTEGPVWPLKKLVLVGMLLLGVLVGTIAIFARIQLRSSPDVVDFAD